MEVTGSITTILIQDLIMDGKKDVQVTPFLQFGTMGIIEVAVAQCSIVIILIPGEPVTGSMFGHNFVKR